MRDLPAGGILGEDVQAEGQGVGAGLRNGVIRFCVSAESSAIAPEVLVDLVGLLIRLVRQNGAQDEVSGRAGRVGGGEEVRAQRHGGQARKAGGGNGVVRKRLTSERVDGQARIAGSDGELAGGAGGGAEDGQTGAGEIPGKLGWIGNKDVRRTSPDLDAPTFIVGQEKCFVVTVVDLRKNDGAVQNEAILILAKLRFGRLKVGAGIKRVVAVELEQSSMNLVGTALRDDVDLVCAEAKLRRVGFALDLELLDRVLGKDDGRCWLRAVSVFTMPSRV